MDGFRFSRTLVLIFLTCLAHQTLCENDNPIINTADSSSVEASSPPVTGVSVTSDVQTTTPNDPNTQTPNVSSSSPNVPSPTVPSVEPTNSPKFADICNTSLITSLEGNEDAVPVKCACTSMYVHCSNLGITELQSLISFPKEVQIADFRGNSISNINRDTFYNGRGLMELDLSYNRIDFVSSEAFMALKKLRRLDLSHNKIWSLPTTTFHELSLLKVLNLGFNDLIDVTPSLFSALTDLRQLNMEVNPLEELQPKQFEHLQKLELLNLQHTLLGYLPDHIFMFTPRLKFLNLAGNMLMKVPTQSLHVLDRVKMLDLRGNPIDVIPAEAFRGMTGVVNLYLDNMPELSKIEDYAFGDMAHLEELHCSYNPKLVEIGEHAFIRKIDNSKVPLMQLFLRQNQLSTIHQSLLDWNSDVELHLRGNPLHCDCKADWMVNMKLKNNFQNHIKCSAPGDFENLLLSELKGHTLTCGLHLSEIVMIVCSVVAAFLIIVMIAAFLLWRQNYTGYRKPHYNKSRKRYVNEVVYAGTGDDDI